MNWQSACRRHRLHSTLRAALGGTVCGVASASASVAQQQTEQAPAAALAFDNVTVIDIEHGAWLPAERVVVVGNRITAVGPADEVSLPKDATVVDAQDKYLIPGLWDVHVHLPGDTLIASVTQQLMLVNGVTAFRDAGTPLPLATATGWARDVLAGRRIGPARQFFSGQSLADSTEWANYGMPCDRAALVSYVQTCVHDVADAIHVVDSLEEAGATVIKMRGINSGDLYFAIAREARRLGLPFGGHIQHGMPVSATGVADSGATFLEHPNAAARVYPDCLRRAYNTFSKDTAWPTHDASLATCQPLAQHLAAKNTWFVPTLTGYALTNGMQSPRSLATAARTRDYNEALWSNSMLQTAAGAGATPWLIGPAVSDTAGLPSPDSIGMLGIAQRAGLPILAGTDVAEDVDAGLGFATHTELALLVAEGMTPLGALQAATLNPAKALRLSDSLGTIATGKLADLVLLDADPLSDIRNTTAIRAVVANGRYFDRSALDRLLAGRLVIPKPGPPARPAGP